MRGTREPSRNRQPRSTTNSGEVEEERLARAVDEPTDPGVEGPVENEESVADGLPLAGAESSDALGAANRAGDGATEGGVFARTTRGTAVDAPVIACGRFEIDGYRSTREQQGRGTPGHMSEMDSGTGVLEPALPATTRDGAARRACARRGAGRGLRPDRSRQLRLIRAGRPHRLDRRGGADGRTPGQRARPRGHRTTGG